MAALVGVVLLSACAPRVPPATAAQRAQVRVTLYTTAWCPVCTRARAWLHQRGIPFRELDVERRPSAAARHAMLNPARTVPTFDIEGRVLVGFVASDVRTAIDRVAHTYPPRELAVQGEAEPGGETPTQPGSAAEEPGTEDPAAERPAADPVEVERSEPSDS
ncbi:MAG: glutaredoxin family protein [Sandaracinaceae bacterium]